MIAPYERTHPAMHTWQQAAPPPGFVWLARRLNRHRYHLAPVGIPADLAVPLCPERDEHMPRLMPFILGDTPAGQVCRECFTLAGGVPGVPAATAPASSAEISACGRYRYRLERRWGEGPPAVFVMLNPSTADATANDPTVRRCIKFAERWGFGGLVVVNLYAWRSTTPFALYGLEPEVAVGPENDRHLLEACQGAGAVVAAWGTHGALHGRGRQVLELLAGAGLTVEALGLTKEGHPRHPLYTKGTTARIVIA